MCRDFLLHGRRGIPMRLTNSRAQSRRIDRFKGTFRLSLRIAQLQPLTTEPGLVRALYFALRCHIRSSQLQLKAFAGGGCAVKADRLRNHKCAYRRAYKWRRHTCARYVGHSASTHIMTSLPIGRIG